jgi:hypothetical protein
VAAVGGASKAARTMVRSAIAAGLATAQHQRIHEVMMCWNVSNPTAESFTPLPVRQGTEFITSDASIRSPRHRGFTGRRVPA